MLSTAPHSVDDNTFYSSAIQVLRSEGLPFLVGGAYAMRIHAGVERDTKDFDLFVQPCDVDAVIAAFRDAGYRADYAFTHWLAKVHGEGQFMDIIYRAGNGLCDVDDEWFANSSEGEFFGMQLGVCPPEEMIWQKAFIMERERYDGADILHLLRSCGASLDWERLLRRFGSDGLVLLSHLVLFHYVYPQESSSVPEKVMDHLLGLLSADHGAAGRLCRGPLVSRLQYLDDIEKDGYRDPRSDDRVRMTETEIRQWTEAAREQALLMAEQMHPAKDH